MYVANIDYVTGFCQCLLLAEQFLKNPRSGHSILVYCDINE